MKTTIIFYSTDIKSEAGNKRVLIMPTHIVADIRSACNTSNGVPSADETNVLVKKGEHKKTKLNSM